MRAPLSNFEDESIEPVSIATMRSAPRLCVVSEATTSGSHGEPSWTTRSAVTPCELIRETYRLRL